MGISTIQIAQCQTEGLRIPEHENILKDYKQTLIIKKYSSCTLEVYYPVFKNFVWHFDKIGKDIRNLHYGEIFDYIKEKTSLLNLSEFKQFISAIKFFYEKILDKDKMYFNRAERFKIIPVPVKFDFHGIQKIAGSNISSPSHRLLLYLSFYLGMLPKDIINLSMEPEDQLGKYDNFRQNELAKAQIFLLIEQHNKQYKNNQYLFEKKGRRFEPDEMKLYIRWIVTKYRIEEVFRIQFSNILMQTDFCENTKKQYESMFLTFIRETGYKHPSLHSAAYIKDN